MTTSLFPRLTALLVFLLPVVVYAQHENQAYLPLTASEISKKFPITYVGTLGHRRPGYLEIAPDQPLTNTINVGPYGALIKTTADDEDLLITGESEWTRRADLHELRRRLLDHEYL